VYFLSVPEIETLVLHEKGGGTKQLGLGTIPELDGKKNKKKRKKKKKSRISKFARGTRGRSNKFRHCIRPVLRLKQIIL
jgi:hypothetical protein